MRQAVSASRIGSSGITWLRALPPRFAEAPSAETNHILTDTESGRDGLWGATPHRRRHGRVQPKNQVQELAMRQLTLASLAFLSVAALPALCRSAVPGGTSGESPCADTEFHAGSAELIGNAFRCDCSEGKVQVAGGAQIPGVAGLGGSYSDGSDEKPGSCQSVTLHPDYWERVDEKGNSVVIPSGEVQSITLTATCDDSGCHQFLWVLWSYGHAKCHYDTTYGSSFVTYKETGEACGPQTVPATLPTTQARSGRASS